MKFRCKRFQMRLRTLFLSLFFLSFINSYAQYPPSHDPSRMIRNDDGRYWIFTTGDGVWAMSSSNADFTDWQAESTPFGSSWPSWINNQVPGFDGNFWAPDIIQMNGYYYLYYSASTFGSSTSAIGVARASSLDGNWTDLGMVVSSNGGSNEINAIDPGLFQDPDGSVWMTYGSFFGGIGIVEINPSTGKATGGVTSIAGGNQQDIEAPFIMKNGNYYYLFVNRGSCCNGTSSTYYVQVARSTSVTGPYTGWREFLPNQDGRFIGPGHIGYGEGRLTYHFYDGNDSGNPKLRIRTDFGFSNGWPYVGSPPSSGGPVSSGGTYRITPRHSGKAIDVENCGTGDGTNVRQWSWLNNNCQKWIFTDAGNGTWRISPSNASGEALDVTNCSGANSTNIELWSWLDNDCQKWNLVDMGGGYYQIVSQASGKCLDISGNSSSDGANLIQYTCNSNSYNQQFSFNSETASRSASSNELDSETRSNLADQTNKAVQLYPNPVKDVLSIKLPGSFDADSETRISVYSDLGQLLQNKDFTGTEYSLDISEMPSGAYFVKLENGSRSVLKKVLKQ